MPSSPHSDLSPTQKSPRLPRQPHRVAGAVHCNPPAVKTRANEPPSAKGAGNFTHSKFKIQHSTSQPLRPLAMKSRASSAAPKAQEASHIQNSKFNIQNPRAPCRPPGSNCCAEGAGNFSHSTFKIQNSTSPPPSWDKLLILNSAKLPGHPLPPTHAGAEAFSLSTHCGSAVYHMHRNYTF